MYIYEKSFSDILQMIKHRDPLPNNKSVTSEDVGVVVDQSCQPHDQTTEDTTDPSCRTTRHNMMTLAADHQILTRDILR